MKIRSIRRLALTALACVPVLGQAAPPANDICTGAFLIPASIPAGGFSITTDTREATSEGDPAFLCIGEKPAASKSVWFTFVPSVTDNYRISLAGTTPAPGGDYDTIMQAFTGTCTNLVPVTSGCNDDADGSLQSAVTMALSAGTTYTFIVSGIGSRDPMNPANIVPTSGGSLKFNVSRVAVDYPYSYVIPSVARFQGVTLYVSDVNITNTEATEGTFTMQFLGNGRFSEEQPPASQPTLSPVSIPALGSREFVDVIGNAFGRSSDFGAIRVRSTRRLQVGARTYTGDAAAGTFGQYVLAVETTPGSTSELLSYQETGRLIGVREDADFRTNLAFFSISPDPCGAQLEVRAADGLIVAAGAKLPVLPPNTMVQISGLKDYFGFSDDVKNAQITVRNVGPGCQFGAVAYVIDRKTQDPLAIPLKK